MCAMRLRPIAPRCSTAKDRAALVVRQQRQRLRIVRLGEDVDHRQAVGEGADRHALVGAAGGDHQAIHPLAQQLVEMLALARRIVGRVAHEDGDALVGQPLLQRLDDRKSEPAETVVGDDADGARLRPVQALRQVVGPIADLARHAHHVIARFLAQAPSGIQRLGDRADRDAGHPGDVADGWRAAHGRRGLVGRGGWWIGVVHYLIAPLRKPET